MSKRYFINNIDHYLGQQLLAELHKPSEDGEPQDPADFKIMATYSDPHRTDKQLGVKKILKRYKPKLSRKKMLEENDVWIYDTSDSKDLEFALDILEKTPLEEQKVLILMSDLRAWGNTPKKQKIQKVQKKKEIQEEEEKDNNQDDEEKDDSKEEEEKDDKSQDSQQSQEDKEDQKEEQKEEIEYEEIITYEAYTEADYAQRVPLEEFKAMKEMEDKVLALQKDNVKVMVVCAGIFYGRGEIVFKHHFQAAWKQDPEFLPYLGDGENLLPTINIKDLVKFVVKVAENPPENEKYLLQSEHLRPMKVMVYYPKDQNYDAILKDASEHYKIPIITLDSILDAVLKTEAVKQLTEPSELSETAKILFRCIKWRLSQNDCINRGYILTNCLTSKFMCDIIFFDQKKRLMPQQVKQKKEGEEEQEEEAQEEEQQDGQDDEEGGPKQEAFYPESVVVLKKLSENKRFECSAFDFYRSKSLDLLLYDSSNRTPFEILSSLRVYIERNGRPKNYIKDETELKKEFDTYFNKMDKEIKNNQKALEEAQLKSDKEQQTQIDELLAKVRQSVKKEVANPQLLQNASLRTFLMREIMPTLSDGLLEVAKVRPEDPQEFLAEYLYEKSFEL